MWVNSKHASAFLQNVRSHAHTLTLTVCVCVSVHMCGHKVNKPRPCSHDDTGKVNVTTVTVYKCRSLTEGVRFSSGETALKLKSDSFGFLLRDFW